MQKDESSLVQTQAKEITLPKKEPLQTYRLLDEDDLDELEFILDKLATEITMMGNSNLEIDDIDTINSYIHKISVLLGSSDDSYNISVALTKLCDLLGEYSHEFLAESKNLSQMMVSFLNDLRMWKDMIFYTGAPSPHFLDNSISSNIEMIRAVFVTEDKNVSDLDDIFDF